MSVQMLEKRNVQLTVTHIVGGSKSRKSVWRGKYKAVEKRSSIFLRSFHNRAEPMVSKFPDISALAGTHVVKCLDEPKLDHLKL